ncbi:MAG: response regulator transcription factor [Lachnospiraceae bacterium]
MQNKKILIVEDEPKIAEAVDAYLKKEKYITFIVNDGRDALNILKTESFDMIILDLMLPSISGEEICKIIRKDSRIPIIMLTAKASEDNKIEGLNIGADDYITKPFSPRELVARVNSLFRRCCEGNLPLVNGMNLKYGDLEVDFNSHTIKKKGQMVNLTPNEFKLFSTLAKYPNKTFTRDELIDIALGMDFDGYDRTIDSHIKNLRSKIENDTTNPTYILTVRGIGYKFGEDLNET